MGSGRAQFVAPDLLGFEFANAVHRLVRGGVSIEAIGPAFETWRQMNIELIDSGHLHQEALTVAVRYGMRASYDVHYLLLARNRGIDLYTCDRRFYNSLRGEWPQIHVVD